MSFMTNITGDGRSFSSGTNIGEDEVNQQHQQQQLHHHILDSMLAAGADSSVSTSHLRQPIKKKRNLPGTPDPTAEVIALSPKTLMATNRFICEICHKGFQRDQNLQLHRRCHNLPWKLRPQTSIEIRKRVYVCPEPTCVHHNPSRALGDLTGIKKHYSRKHGEKKWNCNKCSKKYALQSDWKAHSKICGTKEYKCNCGTIFSRRESFITHRVFCNALVQENTLNQPVMATMASSLQGQAPNLMLPINTSSSLQLSGSGPIGFHVLGDRNIRRSIAGPSHMPATVLLQKAAQIGATAANDSASFTTVQGDLASVIAGPDRAFGSRPYSLMTSHELFDQMRSQGKQSQLVGINGGIANQFYDPSVNHIALFPTVGMSTSAGDGGPGGGDATAVDFLGVGGERSFLGQKQQEAMEYGGIGHQPRLEVLHRL